MVTKLIKPQHLKDFLSCLAGTFLNDSLRAFPLYRSESLHFLTTRLTLTSQQWQISWLSNQLSAGKAWSAGFSAQLAVTGTRRKRQTDWCRLPVQRKQQLQVANCRGIHQLQKFYAVKMNCTSERLSTRVINLWSSLFLRLKILQTIDSKLQAFYRIL